MRSKITYFCQVDKFDTTPFKDMPLVLISDFMELVPNKKHHNTWYRTLRAFLKCVVIKVECVVLYI